MNGDLQSILNIIQQSQNLSDEEKNTLSKAAKKVNKELEIEASLERVRTVAMSMNKPEDMLVVCKTISHELEMLHVKEIRNVQTAIFYKEKGTYVNYEYYAKHNKTFITETSYTNSEIHKAFATQMIKGAGEFFIRHINGDEVKDWLAYQKTTNVFIDDFLYTASSLNYYWFSLGPVALGISTYEHLKEEDISLFKRFLKVFELAYRRYLDIEKAEAQARESQIQLALERVRARTMAMQKSDELKEAAALLFQQVKSLGVPAYSCGYNIWEKDDKEFTSWMSTQDGSIINGVPNIPLTEDANFIRYVESKQNGEPFFVLELRGERMQEHYEYLKTIPAFKGYFDYAVSVGFDLPKTQIHHLANFSQGNLLFITLEPCPEFHDVFKRFAAVFEQTYTRFLDLQKAEAQAREAQIEAALERVRSRSMGMQKSEELKEVIQIVFEQFVHLNINVEHTGFIIDYKESDDMLIWLADKHAVPFQVTIPYFDCAHWNSFNEAKATGKDFFANNLNFEEKNRFYQDLFKLFPVPDEAKDYYFSCPGLAISTVLFDTVGLYIENFSGIPYSEEDNKTLMRFGKVFQQTYTRFNDLKQAEAQARQAKIDLIEIKAARKKAEETLTELQSTQRQLLQSEKMASLGELTAGIAHEIQNPLNFVNNFSEVNKELLQELKEEADKGNVDEVKAIANDVINNEEKINHHGKRADAIVKGMLQHSRQTSGTTEPTDINALCDEYLRLSYHGLRAKDKTFNADFKTDFDESIGKINIIPQDIGRVVLNLLTNAFYAVNEKKKMNIEGYEPTVSVTTKNINGKVEVSVTDNGNGIPQKVLDKIFQPFFTTKPTGQGTGLGLSLSYDIVKAHGGEIKVETKEGESTTFIIILPNY